jgi:muramoyltetrapeptide carboxypeptidase
LVIMSEERSSLLRPLAVNAGAAWSVIAPASFAQPDRVQNGLDELIALGLVPRLGSSALEHGPLFFAGTAQQRLDDLNAAFADETTSAIVCVRGGYGSNYLLKELDTELIRKHPKPFFAYSDLTGIQLRLLDEFGLPAFHGPMLAADFYRENGVHLPSFWAALKGEPYSIGAAEGLRVLRPGEAHGTLYGGCLSILVSLLGTEWEPQTEDKLLFLEDTGAKPYQVDRMLWQLRNAGKLEGVRGIVFGEMLDCVSPGAPTELLEQAILNALHGFEGPIAIGLRSGHVSRQNITLTFGVQAELIASPEPYLQLLEPAVKR